MAKRSTPNKRAVTESKANTISHYGTILKEKSNINPIFLRKPYEKVEVGK